MTRGPFLPAMLAGAALAVSPAAAAVQPRQEAPEAPAFVPIRHDRRADDPVFVQSRCRDLARALRMRYGIEVSNPLTGRDVARGRPLEWALSVDMDASFPEAPPLGPDVADAIADYMNAFGPLTDRQTFLELPLYLLDKETCMPLLRPYGP